MCATAVDAAPVAETTSPNQDDMLSYGNPGPDASGTASDTNNNNVYVEYEVVWWVGYTKYTAKSKGTRPVTSGSWSIPASSSWPTSGQHGSWSLKVWDSDPSKNPPKGALLCQATGPVQ